MKFTEKITYIDDSTDPVLKVVVVPINWAGGKSIINEELINP